MNREEQSERFMPSNQDTTDITGTDASDPITPSDEAVRPGVTDVQAYIGRQLRAVYDDVVKQPIPDRLLALMKQLEEQTPHG